MLQSILKFDALKDRWRFSVWVITLVSVFIELIHNKTFFFFPSYVYVNCNTHKASVAYIVYIL